MLNKRQKKLIKGCCDSQNAVNYDEAFVINKLMDGERRPDRGPPKCTCEEIKK